MICLAKFDFYLMVKSGKSFAKIRSCFQIALFFLFYRNFHPLAPSSLIPSPLTYLILPNVPNPRLSGLRLFGTQEYITYMAVPLVLFRFGVPASPIFRFNHQNLLVLNPQGQGWRYHYIRSVTLDLANRHGFVWWFPRIVLSVSAEVCKLQNACPWVMQNWEILG